MAILLTPQEKQYIAKHIGHHDWWVAQSIIGKIKTDDDEKEKMAQCEHEHGSYLGKKECCAKCGSFFSPGMGFSWSKLKHVRKSFTALPRHEQPCL